MAYNGRQSGRSTKSGNTGDARRSGRSRALNTIRIIAGSCRGRRLSVLNEEGLRPSSDRVRETVFNWFQTLLPGARVLDLFAGTGAFGLEALSRGAATACFVEANPRLVRSIKQVLEDWDLNGVVVESTVQDFLDRTCSESFDIVFCDPPFSSTDYQGLLGFLENAVCFKTVQCLYVEKPKKTTIVPPSGWIMHRNLQYGEVEGIVFKRELS